MKKILLAFILSVVYISGHAQCPVPDAGPDRSTCSKLDTLVLGDYSSSYYWTSWGWGDIVQNSKGSAVYVPSIFDQEFGKTVLFVLHSEPNESCTRLSDTLIVTFADSDVKVDAGLDQQLCRSSVSIDLKGSATNTDTIYWEVSQQGYAEARTLLPSNTNILSPEYIFTDDDKYHEPPYHDSPFLPGDVQFILTGKNKTTGCSDFDYSYVTFSIIPTLKIEESLPSCSRTKHLKGTSNGQNFKWSTSGNGTFEFKSDSLTVDYHASVEDSTSGSATIYLQASNECGEKNSDTIVVKFTNNVIYGNVLAGTDTVHNFNVTYFDITNKDAITATPMKQYQTKYTIDLSSGPKSGLVLISVPKFWNFGSQYLPTYYKSSTAWDTATAINIANPCTDTPVEAIVNLVKAPVSQNTTWYFGADSIKGTVTFADPSNPEPSSHILSPAVVMLYDNSGNYLTYEITDVSGNYSFRNLEAGTYILVTEYPGTKGEPFSITIDGNGEIAHVANLTPSKYDVISSTTTSFNNDDASFLLFPQPAHDELNFKISSLDKGSINVSIYDVTGHLKKELKMAEMDDFTKINIADLEEGFYLIKISNGSNVLQKSFTKIN